MPFPSIQLSTRPLHFIYLCDCSGSMAAQGKMQSLNQAIRQSLPSMAAVARQNPEATIYVRVLAFADAARWHLQTPTPVEQIQWQDLSPEGLTAMGGALELLASELGATMPQHALPPVFVLISDGQPTDDFEAGLQALMAQPWAQKAVRLAIAIGQDADLDVLQAFIGEASVKPLQASNATALAHYIEWASTAVVSSASTPATSAAQGGARMGDVTLPEVPATVFATAKPDNDDFATLTW